MSERKSSSIDRTAVRTIPGFVYVVIATVVGALLFVVGIATAWRLGQQENAEEVCERTVAVRDDNRAMWEYAIDTTDKPNDPRTKEFRIELDTRLPPLYCTADHRPEPLP